MNQHMKAPLVLLALLSLLLVPLAAEAGDHGAEVEKASLFAARGEHAMISLEGDGSVAIELHGKLVDPETGRPLGDKGVEIVRFEIEDGRTLSTVTRDEVTAAAKEVISKETAGQGDFEMVDLAPGRYSLQVAWDEIPAGSDVVRFDLKWFKRPASPGNGR